MNPQFTTFELPRLAMEEVHKCQVSRGHAIAAVIAVEAEEIPVVAGGDLGLHPGNGEFLHAEFLQNLRQHRLMRSSIRSWCCDHVHQNAGAAVFIVDDATIRVGRDHFAGREIALRVPA